MGIHDYEKIRALGGVNGAFLASDSRTADRVVVVKRLRDGVEGIEELSCLLRCQHAHVVRFLESFLHESDLYLVTAYEPGGDLDTHLTRCARERHPPPTAVVLQWLRQLVDALRHCHDQRVLHRDIKPSNILVSSDARRVWLADFGSAAAAASVSPAASSLAGSPLWTAPEVLQGQPYTPAADVWSLGCTLYEMAVLAPPFSSSCFAALVQQVTDGAVRPLPAGTPPALAALLNGMLQADPARRLTLEEVRTRLDADPAAGAIATTTDAAAAT